MVNLIVEHRWKDRDQEGAFKAVSGIVEMAKGNKLPAGYSLKSIQVIGNENMAICNWEAPSKDAMISLLKQVNPPTKHEVFEAQKLF